MYFRSSSGHWSLWGTLIRYWQTRSATILQVVNKSLVKYSKNCKPGTEEHLFGKDFPVALKKEVEQDKSLSQIVVLTSCHHPYDRPRQPTCEPNLGHSGKQFFPKGPAGRQGFQQGQSTTLFNKHAPQRHPSHKGKGSMSRNYPEKSGKF